MEAGMRELETRMGLLDKSGFDENGDINLSVDDLLDREMEEEDKNLLDHLRDHINGCVSSMVSSVGTNEETIQLRDEMEQMRDELNRMRLKLKHPTNGGFGYYDGGNSGESYSSGSTGPVNVTGPHSPKPQMPPNTNEYGEAIIQVGKSSGKYKHTVRHFNPATYSEYIVEFDDGLNYRMTSNTGDALSTGQIKKLITNKLREEARKSRHNEVNQQIVQRMRERVNAPKPPKPRKSDIADELSARYEHQHFMEEKSALFHYRTLLGGKGDPPALRTDASVTVSASNMFGRKYTVEIDGNAMYVPKIELHLKYCFDDDRLAELVESRTEEERQVLKKLLEGLVALKIAEEHHIKLIQLL